MTIFVEYVPESGHYEVTQAGGIGVLTTRKTRKKAIKAARTYAERGEDIAVKGPRSSEFASVR